MMRCYAVTLPVMTWYGCQTYFAETAGKARYQALLDLHDAGWDKAQFSDLRVRSLGLVETPRERAERERDTFNASNPIGTRIRVYPGTRDDEESAYDTTVKEPGAFIVGGNRGTQVAVQIPGDWIVLTHVVVLGRQPAEVAT